MKRIAVLAVLAVCWLQAEPAAEVLQQSQEYERAGQPLRARAVLARAAETSPGDADTQFAYAEFLDRYRDPNRREAYGKTRELLDDGSSDRKQKVLRRLVLLSLVEGDNAAAKKHVAAYREAGGAGLAKLEPKLEEASQAGGLPVDWIEIPGLLNSFRRMAALSTDQQLDELLPALARNVFTNGYRTGRGAETLEQTEYMKLLLQYLSQARELKQLAGSNETINVPACESQETAQILKILGFRLRNDCGPQAVLETVNPSRAFLSIDSAFPLADLELAFRREEPFALPYKSTMLPVTFSADYWRGAARKSAKGDFIEMFLNDPALARLYVAMSNLHEPTAIALKRDVPVDFLKDYAHVLDFFGGMFEISNGHAAVPGGSGAEAAWEQMTGVSPSDPAAFFRHLLESDDGWAAAFFDSLWRVDGRLQEYFTSPKRLNRFYLAVRGKSTSPGPARPIFRSNSDLLLLTTRLQLNSDGSAYIPGGLEPWKKVFAWHEHAIWDGKRNKDAQTWTKPDDIVESMYVFCRRAVNNDPLRMFMAITNVDRSRERKLRPATVERLTEAYSEYGSQFPVFADGTMLSDETIIAYLDLMPKLSKGRNQARRSDTIGMFQGLVGLWQIFVREEQIPEDRADPTLKKLINLFQDVRGDLVLFDAGRAGIRTLLSATNSPSSISPQERLISLLAGKPGPGDGTAHGQVIDKLNTLFGQQRLASLKVLFDLADHLERVSRGESFNVAMANRLASRISEISLPRSELSTHESNAFAHGNWVDKHLQRQRSLNLRRMVDRAQGNSAKLAEVRGELAPILRDTIVGLNYVHYSPPGAQLIQANPLFVRSHDFLGVQGGSSWRTTRVFGTGWPSSAGGRLVGSLVGLPYSLADIEQNFMVPSQRQALIWQDLAPQMLLNATVPKWWGITASEQHFVALHQRLGEELVAQTALDDQLTGPVFEFLRRKVEPARLYRVSSHFAGGRIRNGLDELTAAELFHLAAHFIQTRADTAESWAGPAASEIQRLASAMPEQLSYDRISSRFGVPHPKLADSYRPQLLNLPLFPTLMGYSSRVLAESWESSNLYWAALADEFHLPPNRLNLMVPQWTQKSLERIFATHLDDWPALWRSMRIVANDYRARARPQVEQLVRESLD